MKRYVILFTTTFTKDEAVKILQSCLPGICENHVLQNPCLTGVCKTLFNVVNCVSESSETENLKQENDVWRDLTTESLQEFSLPYDCKRCISTEDLAERLHSLADRLPRTGVFVDVVWSIGEGDNTGISVQENMELFGALTRLVEWNGAHVSLVMWSDTTDMSVFRHWADMLQADMRSVSDLRSSSLLWRGSINITSADTVSSSIKLRGFELHTVDEKLPETHLKCGEPEQSGDVHRQILSSQMEFVAEVDLSEIPGFYITHTAYQMQLSSQSPLVEKSARFLDRLRQNKQLCYLIRLAYGETVTADRNTLTKQRKEKEEKSLWKDFVVENAADLTISGGTTTTESLCNIQHHIMLLHAARTPQSCDSQANDTILAFLLHPLRHLHGNALHDITVSELRHCEVSTETAVTPGGSESVRDLLEVLPHLSANVWLQIQANIERLQTALILAWKDENVGTVPSLELSSLLSSARHQYLQQLDETGWFGLDHVLPPDTMTVARHSTAEYDLDPCEQLERKVLRLKSSSSNARYACLKANDNLDGLSPPHGPQVMTLDATQFCKFFRVDGTALKDDLSPLTGKPLGHPRWRHKPEGELLEAGGWPECGGFKYHGIHYNHDLTSDEIERRSTRLLARLRNFETASTCTVDQSYGATTMTVANSKNHRSQRKCRRDKLEERNVRKRGQKRGADEAFVENNNNDISRDGQKDSLSSSERADVARQQRRLRSQRHKQKLEQVVKDALLSRDVAVEDDIFKSCARRLYDITKSYVKDLTTSRHLKEEMEKIASDHVMQVINFERNRRSAKS